MLFGNVNVLCSFAVAVFFLFLFFLLRKLKLVTYNVSIKYFIMLNTNSVILKALGSLILELVHFPAMTLSRLSK